MKKSAIPVQPPVPTSSEPRDAAPPAIVVENLTVRYGRQTAVRDITLGCLPGTITAVIGPSGCGKTSFLMSLNRLTDLVPGCRVSGTVHIGDQATFASTVDVVHLRRQVGMIFQRPNPFPLSIVRNLELPLREHGVTGRDEIQVRIEQSLRDAALWDEVKDRLHRPAVVLSGGQQQRLCIARALVLQPEVLLLDEPCSALDPMSAGTVEALIVGLRRRCTLVVVTHNLAQARRIADQVAFVWSEGEGGRLIEKGATEQIFNSPCENLTAAYLAGRVG